MQVDPPGKLRRPRTGAGPGSARGLAARARGALREARNSLGVVVSAHFDGKSARNSPTDRTVSVGVPIFGMWAPRAIFVENAV